MSRATAVIGAACAGGGDAFHPPAIPAADAIPSRSGTSSAAHGPSSATTPAVSDGSRRLFPVRPHARLTAEFWDAVLRRLQEVPPKVVAHEIGLSEPAFRMRLSRAGRTCREVDAEGLHPRASRIVALRREGKTHKEIADAMGITPSTVNTVLNRARKRGIEV